MDSHSALFTWQLSCGTKIQIKHEFGKRFSHHLCMYVATSITYLDEPRSFYNKFAYLTGDICERAYIVKACAVRMTVLQVSVLKAELNKCMSLLSNWRRFATLRWATVLSAKDKIVSSCLNLDLGYFNEMEMHSCYKFNIFKLTHESQVKLS